LINDKILVHGVGGKIKAWHDKPAITWYYK
jgi:hypothetical protein